MKVLIIGGVAAGTKVAAKLKRENFAYDVTILTKSKDISYAGCGLPYYVSGVIEDSSQLIVNTPESFSKLTGVSVLTEMEVTKVNPEEKTVDALNLKTQESLKFEYNKLVIASGAEAIKPPIDGVNLKNVFLMRTPDDAYSLRQAVDSGETKRAIVVGGGYVGLEIAENLSSQGIKTVVIDMAKHILPGFDDDFAEYVENHLADQGIMTFTETKLEAILGEEKAAVEAGFNPVSVVAVVDDKAHYYPDASSFIVKMIADRESKKLLGLQVLGKGAVDKMVDIAVTAITMGESLEDIENMDLAYAPPFSTAIHPFSHTINILLNKISGAFETITPVAYAAGDAEEFKVIDASLSPSIDGAHYIDLEKVKGELTEFKKDEKLLLVCAKGKRAYMLQNRLKHFGYSNTLVLEDGTTFNELDK